MKILNNTNEERTYHNHVFAPMQEQDVLDTVVYKLINCPNFLDYLIAGEVVIDNITDPVAALNKLKGLEPKAVIPKTPANEHDLLGSSLYLLTPAQSTAYVDFVAEQNCYFWGAFVHAEVAHLQDKVKVQVVHPEYGVIKTFCDWFVIPVLTKGGVQTPDGAPAELPQGIIIRYEYTNAGETDAELFINNIVTVKS